ncbi:MAG: PSD1 and planctomycete cytochrome C domain-containing protein [Pirellulaceae bacterium]
MIPAALLAVTLLSLNQSIADEVRFSRDVLPILADRCFHCHGPDAAHREAELRLDVRESAVADRGGYAAIVPADPDASELMRRITTDDADLVMPPPDSHRKPLADSEVATLRQWIADGAEWGKHWSFEPPVRPEIDASATHPIDFFVRRRLAKDGLHPAPPADRHTLIRRVSFDLTGLPPTWDEVRGFLDDESDDAYERVVDRLLDSPHYGERMAMWWLDAARYSDTDGFQQDATRTNWPWRDWVIQSFNQNMPFDQFTVEQFAGDLLPDATLDQHLATCFHRNHMTNGEGGRDPEESRVDYVIDRVNTMGTVWLGLTLGCCQCHSHKFDPISQHDYYSLTAFFNSIDEDGRAGGGAKPYLKYKSPHVQRAIDEAQRVVEARKQVETAAKKQAVEEFEPWLAEQRKQVVDGFEPWRILRVNLLETVEGTLLTREDDGTIQASGPNPRQDDYRITASVTANAEATGTKPVQLNEKPPTGVRVTGLRLEIFPHASHTDGKLSRGASGEFILTDVKLQVKRRGQSQVRDIDIASAIADAEKGAKGREYGLVKDTLDDDPRNGWTTETHDATQPHVAVFALAEPLYLADDEELLFVMLHRSTRGDANIGRFRLAVTDQPGPAVRSLDPMPLEELAATDLRVDQPLPAKLRDRLLAQFLSDHGRYQQVKSELDQANRQLAEVKRAAGELNVMVLAERKEPRPTHILERGVWDKKGDVVQRRFPVALEKSDPTSANDSTAAETADSLTRLDLARWLVAQDNPLTARVVANHLWQICFGAGLVRTPEDFGLQGELPTHPELLDWLAVELIDCGWDLKHVLRIIVTSDAYRQSSAVTPDMLERDPENRLLARGSRYRLPSWMIRDAALRDCGLLNPALGGPPTMPYQPDGVWAEMFMGRFRYEPSQGPAQFRRTVYAFWRRASAPTFLFDSAQRRVCEVRPRLTNTPLQALTLLNDRSLWEASRQLARDAITDSDASESRITFMFRRVLSRDPQPDELAVLSRELRKARDHYERTAADAGRLLDFGQPELRDSKQPAELSAYTLLGNMLFNMDEAMTHE